MSGSPRVVLHVLSGDLWGGKEAQLALQLPVIRSLGVDVQLLLLNDGDVGKRFTDLGIPLCFAEEKRGFRQCMRNFRRHIRDKRPGIILSHGYKENILSASASVLQGIPWVPVFHGFSDILPGWQGRKAGMYNRLSRFLAMIRAARLVTVSSQLAEELGFSRDSRLRVVRNVVEIDHDASLKQENLSEQRKTAIAIGRLVPVKRFDLLIRAFSKTEPDKHLLIAGDGPLREQLVLEAEATGVSERCRFLGFRTDISTLLTNSEVFVLSSEKEGIPSVLLEAISFGRKIVCTNVGGIPEVMSHFPSYPFEMVAPNDEDALSQAIERAFLKSQSVPEDTGRTLRQLFSPEVAAGQHLAMYQELSGASGS